MQAVWHSGELIGVWRAEWMGWVARMHALIFLDYCMHKVDASDEAELMKEVQALEMHTETMDYTLENFEGTVGNYKAMLANA